MRTTKLVLGLGAMAAVAGVAYYFTSSATLVAPAKVAVDKAGNLYISDSHNSTIDKLTPGGRLTIMVGEPGQPGFVNGKGRQARFSDPAGIAITPDGALIVADEVNNVISEVTPDGVVTALAGTRWSPGFGDAMARIESGKASARELADGPARKARFNSPEGLAVDQSGNVYVADTGNDVIRKIAPNGLVSTIAGQAGVIGYKDGAGRTAKFAAPVAIAVDGSGNLYVADAGNKIIRKIAPNGFVSTLAGKAGEVGSADGKGETARFNQLRDIAIGPAGNLFVLDSENCNVRKISPEGEVSTVAGEHSNEQLPLNLPSGIAVDHMGNLYVTGFNFARVVKISHFGGTTILADYFGKTRYAAVAR